MDTDMIISFHRNEPPRSKSRRRGFSALVHMLGVVLFAQPLVAAAQVPVPPDLGPGESYHLVFTSSTSRNGLSANIGDYDALVQAAANSAGIGSSQGVTWRAIASTATVSARDHTLVGANTPVYNLNLERVANGNADFWDGTLLKPLGFDEQGDVNSVDVWTGSNINGTSANGLALGGATAWCGASAEVSSAWINNITPSTETVLSVYGLSQALAAPGFTMNAGLNDAWSDPGTDKQGFFVTVFPDIGKVFVAWFTYDIERPAGGVEAQLGEPGHRWLTALGDYSGDTAVLDIELTQGGVFAENPPDPTQTPGYGTLTLRFSDCNSGEVEYTIPSLNQSGTIPIQRVALDNVVLCEALQTP